MRIDTLPLDERLARRRARQGFWHRWFAWYPVTVDSHIVWLETVERVRRVHWYDPDSWEYRFVAD